MKKLILLMLLLAGGLQAFSQQITIDIRGTVNIDSLTIEKNVPIVIIACDSNKIPFDSVVSKNGVFDLKFKHDYHSTVYVFFKAKEHYPDPIFIDGIGGSNSLNMTFDWEIMVLLRKEYIHTVSEAYLIPNVNTGAVDWITYADH